MNFPERLFAAGEEPIGQRVNSYQKSNRINSILNSLDADEVEKLCQSPFGKLVDTANQPSFSPAFGHYILTRLLTVKKKHEIWFIFAGRPIRVSLREFSIVTGLCCSKFPKTIRKKKKKPKKQLSEEIAAIVGVKVDRVTKILRKKKVSDKDIRFKYACLALTSGVLCPTSHYPKIIDEHAELVEDINSFFEFPWGRLAFDMVVSAIRSKDPLAWAQSSFALRGFVHAIQLVLVAAVPALTEVVEVGESSSEEDSDTEGDDENEGLGDNVESARRTAPRTDEAENNNDKECKKSSMSLSPGHARDVDEAGKVPIWSILPCDDLVDESQLTWSDDENDEKVENMVKLIREGFHFEKKMFGGGLTNSDLERMKREKKEAKEKKDKEKAVDIASSSTHGPFMDASSLVEIVAGRIKEELSGFDTKISNCLAEIKAVREVFQEVDKKINQAVADAAKDVQEKVIEAVVDFLQSSATIELATEDPTMCGRKRTSGASDTSIPVSGAEGNGPEVDNIVRNVLASVPVGDGVEGNRVEFGENGGVGENEEVLEDNHGGHVQGRDGLNVSRKSGRVRSVPVSFRDYEGHAKRKKEGPGANPAVIGSAPNIDYSAKYAIIAERLQTEMTIDVGNGTTLTSEEILDIVRRSSVLPTKVVDALMHLTSVLFMRICPGDYSKVRRFVGTKFAATITKQYPKFSRLAFKDRFRFKFSEDAVILIRPWLEYGGSLEKLYFPFFVDKQHWVGVVVDIQKNCVQILDCHPSLRSDNLMRKELTPFAAMFPYLLKFVIGDKFTFPDKGYTIDRAAIVPFNSAPGDSAITTVLLLQAHAMVGYEGCACIKPDHLGIEAEKLSVLLFEECAEAV